MGSCSNLTASYSNQTNTRKSVQAENMQQNLLAIGGGVSGASDQEVTNGVFQASSVFISS